MNQEDHYAMHAARQEVLKRDAAIMRRSAMERIFWKLGFMRGWEVARLSAPAPGLVEATRRRCMVLAVTLDRIAELSDDMFPASREQALATMQQAVASVATQFRAALAAAGSK